MPQKREQVRKRRETARAEEGPKTGKPAATRSKKEELDEKIAAMLEKIEALLKEHGRDSRNKKGSPHIHLCDGTKIDLRKLFK